MSHNVVFDSIEGICQHYNQKVFVLRILIV